MKMLRSSNILKKSQRFAHGSFHEEKIADYVENFAKEHDFKYVRDDMNNVIIY